MNFSIQLSLIGLTDASATVFFNLTNVSVAYAVVLLCFLSSRSGKNNWVEKFLLNDSSEDELRLLVLNFTGRTVCSIIVLVLERVTLRPDSRMIIVMHHAIKLHI